MTDVGSLLKTPCFCDMVQFIVLSGGAEQFTEKGFFDTFKEALEYAKRLSDLQIAEYPEEEPDVEIVQRGGYSDGMAVWNANYRNFRYVNYSEATGVSDAFETAYQCRKDAEDKVANHNCEISLYAFNPAKVDVNNLQIDDCDCIGVVAFDMEEEFPVPFVNKLYHTFTISRADYENMPIPMRASAMSNEVMFDIADEIGYQMSLHNFDEGKDDDDLLSDMEEVFWQEMEDVAVHTGMKYYED